MNRQETKYNKLIGRIDKNYYFLDEIFKYDENFQGATGSVMNPLTEAEYNKRVENYFETEHMREFWSQAVEANKTDLGLDDWIELVKNTDREEGVIDRSYATTYGKQLKELLGEDKVFEVECSGGGRCFYKDMKWDELFNENLWQKIKQVENKKS